MSRTPLDLSVYLVTDTAMCGDLGVPETVRRAVASGVTVVQLRDPQASDDDFVALGRAVAGVLAGTGVPLIVNDRVHLVSAIGADGAHVGQADLDVSAARDILGPHGYLGLSVHTLDELAAARAVDPDGSLIDYLGIGPLRETASKLDHKPVRGLAHLRSLTAASPWPCVAIGGVKAADASDLREAGLEGMAVISAICGQANIHGATRELVDSWFSPFSRSSRSSRGEAQPRVGRPPVALSIAGSDPSGGAGIQADLKTFSALGAYGTCIITALTAQSTTGVTGVHEVPTDFVAQQIDTLVADVRIDAVKIGMLASAGLADLVGSYLGPDGPFSGVRAIPVVLDPVMVSTSGSRLLRDDAVAAVRGLLPLASVVTPNLAEASVLTGLPLASTLEGMRAQAIALRGLGAARVLLKGGHLSDTQDAVDLWLDEDGEQLLRAERVQTRNTHGTGCTLSSAIAALRPQRGTWIEAVRDAKAWLTQALTAADGLDVGHGPGPVHHFHEQVAALGPVTGRWLG